MNKISIAGGTEDQILIDNRMIEVFICPICGSERESKKAAEACLITDKAIELAKKSYVNGRFLLIGEQIIPVWNMAVEKFGDYPQCTFTHLDSNDLSCINKNTAAEWLNLGIISMTITDAVKFGWRAFFANCWHARATIEMKNEYLAAIDKIIANMSEETKHIAIRRAIMFKNK